MDNRTEKILTDFNVELRTEVWWWNELWTSETDLRSVLLYGSEIRVKEMGTGSRHRIYGFGDG